VAARSESLGTLPGESSLLRADEKSAEAVVASKPLRGRRAKGPRTTQQTLATPFVGARVALEPTPEFDPEFISAHSDSDRSGRSAPEAVGAAQESIRAGHTWIVEVDIRAFFDERDPDIPMRQISGKVKDKGVLGLIGENLRAPIQRDRRREKPRRGTPQGGPLSPLLSNSDRDILDKELGRRGPSFCRYADEVMLFVKSQRSGQRVLERLTRWLGKRLKLGVNAAKRGVNRVRRQKIPGFPSRG